MLLSSDPIEVLDEAKEELELDFVYGNVFGRKKGLFTGVLQEKVDRYDRADKILEIVKENDLSVDDVFIVGNSITAIPSSKLGKFISFDSKNEKIDSIADYSVRDDLLNIKEILLND